MGGSPPGAYRTWIMPGDEESIAGGRERMVGAMGEASGMKERTVRLVYPVDLVCLVGRIENRVIWFVWFVSFIWLADRRTKETRKPDKLNKPEKPGEQAW